MKIIEIKEKKTITVIIVLLLAIWFYWFQLRPIQNRSSCDRIAWDSAYSNWGGSVDEEAYDWKYTQCLHSRGLK